MNNKQMEMMAREHDMSGIDPEFAEEVAEAAAKGTVGGYKKIENGVVSGYKKIEEGAVSGFNKVNDKCVEKLFAKEGESVEDAKKRLRGETDEK